MFIGAYQLGDRVPLAVLTDALPAAAPVAVVHGETGPVYSTLLPQIDRAGAPRLFTRSVHLDARWTPGYYSVQYAWTVAGSGRALVDTFQVLPNGHRDGAVIALYAYHRPHADFLVQQVDSGKIVKGRNPSI
jgi:hypothetical protein